MKARTMACWAALLWLAGCNGGEETAPNETERLGGVAQPEAEPAPDEAERAEPPAVAPFSEPARIDTTASLRPDRRLRVQGETNLPEGAQLRIVVEREASGVRWQSRTAVASGRFAVGPLGPGSGFPDGSYTIRVNLQESTVQPEAVRARIGEEGEHLSGPLVTTSRHGLGQVVSYSERYLIGSEPSRTTDQVEVLEVE
ncbi:hypothetical protein [Halomonas sp. NO4]|uniref:hypothetical protein n=1 Tax=Halomonas sp. NO4 TaxID=2484813 RepID=UPI0013D8269B|nr:hypothetical protein [Halomonas sp. NO4]